MPVFDFESLLRLFQQWEKCKNHRNDCYSSGVPNLGYIYPQGYICLSEGVYLKLAEDEKNIFIYYLFPNIYTVYILLSIITKNHMLIVKYVYE